MRSAYSSATLPRRRERDAALRAIEEPHVQVLLELPDLEGDRRLGHEQRLGRLGERKVLRDRVEDLEAPVGHAPILNGVPAFAGTAAPSR